MALESEFRSRLIEDLHDLFPECIVVINNPNYIQGFPDILILFEDMWAALETKKESNSSHRPNQDYYVDMLNQMSYASFVNPENKERVLDELQQAFRSRRTTRLPRR